MTVLLGVCVCFCLCLESKEGKERGGEKAHQLEKVTLPVVQNVIPTGIGAWSQLQYYTHIYTQTFSLTSLRLNTNGLQRGPFNEVAATGV